MLFSNYNFRYRRRESGAVQLASGFPVRKCHPWCLARTESYLNPCARSSPANVMANYGEVEKSGKFFSQKVGLARRGDGGLISVNWMPKIASRIGLRCAAEHGQPWQPSRASGPAEATGNLATFWGYRLRRALRRNQFVVQALGIGIAATRPLFGKEWPSCPSGAAEGQRPRFFQPNRN